MSEGLVNIDLPWHIPEYTYQQHIWMEVLELLQWWHAHLVVNGSSLLMQAEMEEGTMPTLVNNQGQVIHTAGV